MAPMSPRAASTPPSPATRPRTPSRCRRPSRLIDERVAKGGGKPKRGRKPAKKAAAKPAKADTDAKAAKPAKKPAAKKSAAKPKSDAASKARAPVTATAKTSAAKAAKPVAKKSAGKASAGKASGRKWQSNATGFFRAGTPSSPLSARNPSDDRDPRDRARVRPEERRPRRAEAYPARARRPGHDRQARQEDPASRNALPPTVMADITGRDSDGELIATPDRMG